MEELRLSAGIKEYQLKTEVGEVSVYFNPTDESFISRILDTFDTLDAKQSEYSEAITKSKSTRETLDIMKKMNEEMREHIQLLFDGRDIVTPLIGTTNVYAFSDGLPIWANILTAIIEKLEGEFDEQKKLSKKRIAKYTAKYEASDHKKKKK